MSEADARCARWDGAASSLSQLWNRHRPQIGLKACAVGAAMLALHTAPECEMDYTIRRSARARHVWLRFTSTGDLVVVVPRRFDERLVPDIVESNHEWVQRAAHRVAHRRREEVQEGSVALPAYISLPATGQEWTVEYRRTNSSRVMVLERPDGRLVVTGATSDAGASREALARWLHRVARDHLAPRLREVAGEGGFVVSRVGVRSQRTRWASCSRKGTISLNLRLMFIPPELVRHIMLHELCHTVRMDHSKQFWTLLERYDRDWRDHRRRLRAAWRGMPVWFVRQVT